MEILSFENVSLTYQTPKSQTDALKNLSFTVNEGEFVALVGPSGCCKTTGRSLVSGLMPPTSGSVNVDGAAVDAKKGYVGYMLQKDNLFEWRTILKNVLLGPEVQKKLSPDTVAYAHSLLDKYGLKDFKNSYPNMLSGGMRQRVALIRTLVTKPKLLLLDEPFSALDFQTRLSVCDDVYAIIKQEKKTALLVTHDISEAVSVADRIIVLTPRPACVKSIFTPNLDADTPFKRRADPQFSKWFDTVWKEVCNENER